MIRIHASHRLLRGKRFVSFFSDIFPSAELLGVLEMTEEQYREFYKMLTEEGKMVVKEDNRCST